MSANDHDQVICLQAIGAQTYRQRQIGDQELFWATEDDAAELVCGGRSSVAPRQSVPPQKILDRLKAGSLNMDQIGPVSLDEMVLSKFEGKALSQGTRKTIVEGRVLEWCKGRADAKRRFRDLQSNFGGRLFESVLAQLDACVETKHQSYAIVSFANKLSHEEVESRGLIHSPTQSQSADSGWLSREPRKAKYVYLDLGSAWYGFHVALQDLKAGLDDGFADCLAIGRILTVEDTAAGAMLVAPSLWSEKPPSPKDSQLYHYVMARDLPASWYRKGTVLKGKTRDRKVADLVKILEANYVAHIPEGLKLKKKTFVDLAVKERGVLASVAMGAWTAAHIPHWKDRGRVPEAQLLNHVDFTLMKTKW